MGDEIQVREEAKENHQEHKDEEEEEEDEEVLPTLEPQRSKVQEAAQTLPSDHGRRDQQQLLAPDGAMWRDVSRPVDFQSRQERGGYAVLAAVPGLSTRKLEIKLSDDRSALTVEGVCEPTNREAEHMRHQLVGELQRVARTSPQRFRQLCCNLDKVATQTYAELGEGRFGKFSETFRLPSDVDAQRINASFDDGVLRLTLPRRVRQDRQEARPMTARHPFGHQRHAGFWGHPGFGW